MSLRETVTSDNTFTIEEINEALTVRCGDCRGPITCDQPRRHMGMYVSHRHVSDCLYYVRQQADLEAMWKERNDCS